MAAGDAELGVLCADHHPGYSQPIGGAVAYERHISPSGVGYDIGCGNKAVLANVTRAQLDADPGVERVMEEIAHRISCGVGVPAREQVEQPVLERFRAAPVEPQRRLLDLARKQL